MTRILLLLSLVACSPRVKISPAACGGTCSSSSECEHTISSCKYCYAGHCSSVLPATPLDAGPDAPGGTTSKGTVP